MGESVCALPPTVIPPESRQSSDYSQLVLSSFSPFSPISGHVASCSGRHLLGLRLGLYKVCFPPFSNPASRCTYSPFSSVLRVSYLVSPPLLNCCLLFLNLVDRLVLVIKRKLVFLRSRGGIHPRSFQSYRPQYRSQSLYPGPRFHHRQHRSVSHCSAWFHPLSN